MQCRGLPQAGYGLQGFGEFVPLTLSSFVFAPLHRSYTLAKTNLDRMIGFAHVFLALQEHLDPVGSTLADAGKLHAS